VGTRAVVLQRLKAVEAALGKRHSACDLQKEQADFQSLCRTGKLARVPKKGSIYFDLEDGSQVCALALSHTTLRVTKLSAFAVYMYWLLHCPIGNVLQATITFSEVLLRLLGATAFPQLDPAQVEPPAKRRALIEQGQGSTRKSGSKEAASGGAQFRQLPREVATARNRDLARTIEEDKVLHALPCSLIRTKG
jgi:hypothetical protein